MATADVLQQLRDQLVQLTATAELLCAAPDLPEHQRRAIEGLRQDLLTDPLLTAIRA